ncbi:MAG: TetR/AcrR family transcriptional regulator [Streptosporangiaceae bacterium]
MPRAGLSRGDVVAAAAELIDEIGYHELTMGLLAQRLGVRAPSLYKHVDGLADLQHRVATLATTELGDAVRDAMQGRAGRDALTALLTATRAYVIAHPGRYTATIGAEFTGPADPLLAASARVIDSIAAVLRGYGVGEAEMVHAIRTIRCTLHGFAALQASNGFQWSGDPDETFDWMIGFIDHGLRAIRTPAGS